MHGHSHGGNLRFQTRPSAGFSHNFQSQRSHISGFLGFLKARSGDFQEMLQKAAFKICIFFLVDQL